MMSELGCYLLSLCQVAGRGYHQFHHLIFQKRIVRQLAFPS